MSEKKPTIAVIGGTGNQGIGLSMRWYKAGYSLIIGSRDENRAAQTANIIRDKLIKITNSASIEGTGNLEAVTRSDVIVLTVPYAYQLETIRSISKALENKILVDVTAPLVPPKVGTVQLPESGSAVVAAQNMLGDNVSVIAAFQNIAAQHLSNLEHNIDCDVLICGNKKADREVVVKLAGAAGMKGWHAGPLANAAAAEALTSVLIFINRAHKIKGAGIRITDGTDNHER